MKRWWLIILIVAIPEIVGAQIPQRIHMTFSLTDLQGNPEAGPVTLHLKIYAQETGGTTVWEETQSNVLVDAGVVSVVLGSVNVIRPEVFSAVPRYLGISLGSDEEMSPRHEITSLPYAYKSALASTLSGIDACSADHVIKRNAQNTAWTCGGIDSAQLLSDPASMSLVSGGAMTVSQGNVGIGTAQASSPLTVQTDNTGGGMTIVGRDNGSVDDASLQFMNYERNALHGKILGKSGGLSFFAGNTELMSMLNGVIEMGSASSQQSLKVHGSISLGSFIYDRLEIGNHTTSKASIFKSSNDISLMINWNAYNNGSWHSYDSTKYSALFGITGDSQEGRFIWQVAEPNDSPSFVELMRLTKEGYLGLGVPNPLAPLHISARQNGHQIAITQESSGNRCYIGLTTENIFKIEDKVYNPQLSLDLDKGNLGLGTTVPKKRLHLKKDIDDSVGLRIQNNEGWMDIGTNNNNLNFNNTAGVLIAYLTNGGDLHIAGNITAGSSCCSSSDIRWKKNIAPISNALTKVTRLRGVHYSWRDPKRGKGPQIGIIAQEVEGVLPEVVHTDKKGYKSVAYGKLTAVLIEAVKEQQKQIESLKKAVAKLAINK